MSDHCNAIERAAIAADAKHGQDAPNPCKHSAAVLRCVHAAVSVATRAEGVSRRVLEARLGVGRSTLDDYLSVKHMVMPLTVFSRMLLDPAVLGAEAHALLVQRLLIEMGVIPLGVHRPAPVLDFSIETLDVMDSVGMLSHEVREAQDEDSPGGRAVTPEERRRIGVTALGVCDEAMQLVPGGESL